MATNRADTLDPALLRRLIFQTCTGKMNLGPDVDLEDCEPVRLVVTSRSLTNA
jgi:ATP-dependent 26S proteasome regulatory subunit